MTEYFELRTSITTATQSIRRLAAVFNPKRSVPTPGDEPRSSCVIKIRGQDDDADSKHFIAFN